MGDNLRLSPAEARAAQHRVHVFDPVKLWGRFGWWYRFWMRVLLGATFERVNDPRPWHVVDIEER